MMNRHYKALELDKILDLLAGETGCADAAAMARGLNALGAEVEERPDGLIVYGKPRLTGGTAFACNDHRVAMSLAVAALGCREPVTIVGADCVSKSWPLFFHDFIRMGGEGHVFQRG